MHALPPGTYDVRLTRVGRRPIVVEGVTVALGQTTELPRIVMEDIATQIDAVRIVADALQFDRGSTASGATIQSEEFSRLPIERDYKSVMSILPQTTNSHRGDALNVQGATGAENGLFIDGVNVTAPFRGETGTSLPYNFVREVEVKTGGFQAQYGRALGAVVNAVTYSGTNTFEGNAFAFHSSREIGAAPRFRAVQLQERSASESDVGVRIGGPLRRDRLWFAAAANPSRRDADWRIGSLGTFDERRRTLNFAGKLTWRAGPSTDVEFSVFGDPTTHDAVSPVSVFGVGGFTPAGADPFLVHREYGGIMSTIRATRIVGAHVVLEGSLSRATSRDIERARTATGRAAPILVDRLAEELSGGSIAWTNASAERLSATLRANLLLAAHTVVAGLEWEELGSVRSLGKPGLQYIERDASGYVQFEQGYERKRFTHRVPTAYVQDTWRLTDWLTLDAGLRWSSQYLYGTLGRLAQAFEGEWQPRIGVVVTPGDDRWNRLYASYGRFYQQLPTNFTTLWYVDYRFVINAYDVDPRSAGATPTSTFDATTLEDDWARNIPNLQAESSDEFQVGYDRFIGPDVRLGVRAVHRELLSAFGWGVNPSSPSYWVIGVPGKGDLAFLPRPARRYTALELSAHGRRGRMSYRGSYVLSRNYGNTKGLFDSDIPLLNPGVNFTAAAPHQTENATGRLPNDRPHVLKLSVTSPVRGALQGGLTLVWSAGTPISAMVPGPTPPGPDYPTFHVQRGTVGRTPALVELSTRLAYEVIRPSQQTMRVIVDVFNIGNQQQAVRVDEQIFLNAAKDVANPRFRSPLAYAPPLRLRLGVEVDF